MRHVEESGAPAALDLAGVRVQLKHDVGLYGLGVDQFVGRWVKGALSPLGAAAREQPERAVGRDGRRRRVADDALFDDGFGFWGLGRAIC